MPRPIVQELMNDKTYNQVINYEHFRQPRRYNKLINEQIRQPRRCDFLINEQNRQPRRDTLKINKAIR